MSQFNSNCYRRARYSYYPCQRRTTRRLAPRPERAPFLSGTAVRRGLVQPARRSAFVPVVFRGKCGPGPASRVRMARRRLDLRLGDQRAAMAVRCCDKTSGHVAAEEGDRGGVASTFRLSSYIRNIRRNRGLPEVPAVDAPGCSAIGTK
jgi:hypothetical protein